jgi:hypothetical protein
VYILSLSFIPFVFFFCFNTISPASVFFSLLYELFIDSSYMVSVFRSINALYTGGRGARGVAAE